jgi:hypothetical protein
MKISYHTSNLFGTGSGMEKFTSDSGFDIPSISNTGSLLLQNKPTFIQNNVKINFYCVFLFHAPEMFEGDFLGSVTRDEKFERMLAGFPLQQQ